jgi:hypothetical protein
VPAQFNEFYRQCSRRRHSCPRRFVHVSTPDRMLFINGSHLDITSDWRVTSSKRNLDDTAASASVPQSAVISRRAAQFQKRPGSVAGAIDRQAASKGGQLQFLCAAAIKRYFQVGRRIVEIVLPCRYIAIWTIKGSRGGLQKRPEYPP